MKKIPVSVLITTKNEENKIEHCLQALKDFDETIVIDSHSSDRTAELSEKNGASVVLFSWNNQYPKKRQWCLDNLELKHNWIFFVDADEVLTPDLSNEIKGIFKTKNPEYAGYFIKGQYVIHGNFLQRGLQNKKLTLFDRRKIEFPVIDDLQSSGMGEMEGHYQPVLKPEHKNEKIGTLKYSLLHYAYSNPEEWESRHRRYAAWEAHMTQKNAWPEDPIKLRQHLKKIFRALPFRPLWAFLHCYILKAGFLDGRPGLDFALDRARYYAMIAEELKKSKQTEI